MHKHVRSPITIYGRYPYKSSFGLANVQHFNARKNYAALVCFPYNICNIVDLL